MEPTDLVEKQVEMSNTDWWVVNTRRMHWLRVNSESDCSTWIKV